MRATIDIEETSARLERRAAILESLSEMASVHEREMKMMKMSQSHSTFSFSVSF